MASASQPCEPDGCNILRQCVGRRVRFANASAAHSSVGKRARPAGGGRPALAFGLAQAPPIAAKPRTARRHSASQPPAAATGEDKAGAGQGRKACRASPKAELWQPGASGRAGGASSRTPTAGKCPLPPTPIGRCASSSPVRRESDRPRSARQSHCGPGAGPSRCPQQIAVRPAAGFAKFAPWP
jgi:hypothetical protein